MISATSSSLKFPNRGATSVFVMILISNPLAPVEYCIVCIVFAGYSSIPAADLWPIPWGVILNVPGVETDFLWWRMFWYDIFLWAGWVGWWVGGVVWVNCGWVGCGWVSWGGSESRVWEGE